MTKPNKYDAMTTDNFDRLLLGLMEESSYRELLAIPGVYEAVSEYFNNDILQAWEDEQS